MSEILFRRKKGLGPHIFKYRGERFRILGGQTVRVVPSVLGSFLSDYESLDPSFSSLKADVEPLKAKLPEIVPNEAKGWYDVVNPDYPDRPLNDTRLRKKAAEEFLAGMLGEL